MESLQKPHQAPGERYRPPSLHEVLVSASLEEAFESHAQGNGAIAFDDVAAVLKASGQGSFDADRLHEALVVIRAEKEHHYGSDASGSQGEASGLAKGESEGLTLSELAQLARLMNSERQTTPPLQSKAGASFLEAWRSWAIDFWDSLRSWRSCLSSKTDEHQTGMKPTTRLVLIVVLLSFFMALVVGGTAVALDWTSAVSAQYATLQEELDLVLNAADSFTVVQAKIREQQYELSTTHMLAEVINQVGYETNLQTVTNAQLNGVRIAGLMTDSLNELWMGSVTTLMAINIGSIFDTMCTTQPSVYSASTVAPLINTMNQNRLSEGQELILFGANKTLNTTTFFTNFRFCGAGQSCQMASDSSSPVAKALSGKSGTFEGLDYTQTAVSGAYTYLPCLQAGLIYQFWTTTVKAYMLQQTIAAINMVNPKYQGTTEVMIQQVEKFGVPLNVPKLVSQCPVSTGCGIDRAAGKAVLAAKNGTGDPVSIGETDYRQTSPVIAVAFPMQSVNGTLVFEVDIAEVVNNMIPPLMKSSSGINAQLNGTVELLLGQLVTFPNGSSATQYLTDRRFINECPASGCLASLGMRNAVSCNEGVTTMLDYRGKAVLAAFSCIQNLNIGVVLKVDESEVQQRSIDQLIDYTNAQNLDSSDSLELLVGQANPSTPNGYIVLSNPKGDVPAYTTSTYAPMGAALRDKQKGFMRTVGYYGQRIVARYGYSPSLGLGFVLKIDQSEMERTSVMQLIIILFTAIGIALFGVAVVGIAAKKMLASIVATWERSQRVVQEQKENFENLVSALYPKFASDRLLSGDSQIVMELPQVTCFFSDIVGFSTISNRLTAQELMAWIGYTFGVMDHIADFFSIYKIKTIGDSYFAIAGLPGLLPENEPDHHTMRMMKFASTCAQIFSGRYAHPDAGSCLKMIASASAVVRKEKKAAMKKKLRGSASTKTSDSTATGKEGQCMMRYGIASGPVTVGVLPGKCPAFDVWGKTVNLASRMEGNSRSGAILCSEAVHDIIVADPKNPFVFYDQVSTFAKGFGNVPAYFICRSKEVPPKALLNALSIEVAVDDFLVELEGLTVEGKGLGRMGSFRKKVTGGASRTNLLASPSEGGLQPIAPAVSALPGVNSAANPDEVRSEEAEDDDNDHDGERKLSVITPDVGATNSSSKRASIKPTSEAWK